MSKKHLSLALALIMALSMSVGLFAAENHCDHCTYDTYYADEFEWSSGCYKYLTVYFYNVCQDCDETWETQETSITEVCHNSEDDAYCDGTFWYYLTKCNDCGETLSYESGSGCGCGNH